VDDLGVKKHTMKDRVVKPGENALAGVRGELLDVRAEVEAPKSGSFELNLRGVVATYDADRQAVRCGKQVMALKPSAGKVRLRLLLDRGSLELFGNDGEVALSLAARPAGQSLGFTCKGGNVKVVSLEVYEVRSVWAKR
jgi:fructan beta-fructosidase